LFTIAYALGYICLLFLKDYIQGTNIAQLRNFLQAFNQAVTETAISGDGKTAQIK